MIGRGCAEAGGVGRVVWFRFRRSLGCGACASGEVGELGSNVNNKYFVR